MAKQITTREEKAVLKILDALNDVTLDEHMLGLYLTQLATHGLYEKLALMVSEAIETRRPNIPDEKLNKITVMIVEDTPTDFDTRLEILTEFYTTYKDEPEWLEFTQANDIGLPLAFAVNTGIVSNSRQAIKYINDTFTSLLIETTGTPKDTGYTDLDELI